MPNKLSYSSLLCLIIGLFIVACSTQPPVPVNKFYHLPGPQVMNKANGSISLQVNRPRASGIYNERAILYQNDSSPLEVNRYHYALWSKIPALLLQDYIREYLHKAGYANLQSATNVSGKRIRLDVKILRFEQLRSDKFSRAHVKLEFTVQHEGGSKQHVLTAEHDAANQSMSALSAAFGKALDSILKQLLDEFI